VRPRKIALLFLLLGIGAMLEAAWSVKTRLSIGPAGCRILTGKFQGPSYAFESEEVKEGLPADVRLEVDNSFGEVRTFKGEPGRMRLRLRKVVFTDREERARAFAATIHASTSLSGDTVRITTNRRDLEQSSEVGFETHMTIEVPPGTSVKIQNEHGAVAVADAKDANVSSSYETVRVERIAGAADVDSRHADVAVEGVGGALKLLARHGNVDVRDVAQAATVTIEHGDLSVARVQSLKAKATYSDVTVEGVGGDIELLGKHASLAATDVKGRGVIETSFRDVKLEKIAGDVRMKAEHGALDAKDLGGALLVETTFDDVKASGVKGPVDVRIQHGGFKGDGLKQGAKVRASGDDVEIDGFEGPVEVQTERGGVRLAPDKGVADSIAVTTIRGGIRLGVPAGSRFELEASARRGEVQVNVPDITITESSASRVKAHLGQGGRSVVLKSEHGDITIEGRGAAQASSR